jgi:methylated-DNA-[protein]-cysteine S-methyltransferase
MQPKHQAYYAMFESVAGPCGIAWTSRGVIKLQLPKNTRRETERLLREVGSEPASKLPSEIKKTIAAVQRYLKGRRVDFSATPIHVETSPFHSQIYAAVRKIPYGTTLTYGEVAKACGSPGAARAVGRAMSDCDLPVIIPCHRVLASGKKVSGSTQGMSHREKLLLLEGVRIRNAAAKPDPHMGQMDVKVVLKTLSVADPHLGKSIRTTGEFLLTKKREGTPFQAMARAIVYQQLATKAAASIFAKLKTVLEDELTPQAVMRADDDLLRMAGLSRSKLASLRDLAEKTLDGTIPSLRALQNMSDEEVIERLTAVRGIGVWTAQMFLMFALLRPNVLPSTDFGVQKGFQIVYGKRAHPTPKQIEKHAARWHPYKSVASWYLWRATDKAPKRASK